MPKHEDLTGRTFGNLTVRQLSHRRGAVWYYCCDCSCGGTCVANHKSLRWGSTRSCGCLRVTHIGIVNKARRTAQPWEAEMRIYRYHLGVDRASRRHLAKSWELSPQDYTTLSMRVCFYCGAKPAGVPLQRALRNAGVRKNGLDRVDSNKGYTRENCVACCVNCNRAKGRRSLREFIEEAWRRYHHMKATGLMEDEHTIAQVGIHCPDSTFWS